MTDEININSIKRSLEEDVLQDVVNTPIPKYVSGVDSAVDVYLANNKLTSIENKIKALASLIYLKESTILDVKREDAIAGSIYFNRELNTFEFFNGQAWESNIFSPNTVLDTRTFTLTDLGSSIRNGIPSATAVSIPLNMSIEENQVIIVMVDGDALAPDAYYIDDNDSKLLVFITPVTVYSNITYYILGAESSYSGSIPRYEVVEYVADGARTVFGISSNKDFVVSYKSSVMVIVDGIQLRDTEFKMNVNKNQVILNTPPKTGQYVEIKTLYGVETDFRGSLTYVEQISEAQVDNQKTFQYNGVSDAVKVYWNGLRLISGKDFEFNYVQKLVVMKDHIVAQIQEGDAVVIEKELAPMSKEPMQGALITESKKLVQMAITLDYNCNGVCNIIGTDPLSSEDNPTRKHLMQADYYVNGKTLTVTNNNYADWNIQVTYLTNAKIPDFFIPQIDDTNVSDVSKIWSAFKINKELNKKANVEGNIFQDFNTRSIHISNDAMVDGNQTVKGNLTVNHKLSSLNLEIGQPNSLKLQTVDDSDTFIVNQNMIVRKDLTLIGNLTIEGTQSGATLEEIAVDNNIITLNSNLKTNQSPVSESGIVAKRGNKGEASIKFVEADTKWKVITSELPAGAGISLDGHKHNIADLEDFTPPAYNFIASSNNITEDFYKNEEYIGVLEGELNDTVPSKSINRLKLSKSTILESEDIDASEISSASILTFEKYNSIKKADQNVTTKSNAFAIIEDGSPIFNSTGSLQLPAGPTNKRWESDTSYCGIENNNFKTSLTELITDNAWKTQNGLIRYNTTEKCIEFKIDGSWVKLYKPDVRKEKSLDINYNRGRFIKEFSQADFTDLRPEDTIEGLGLQSGEKILKVEHNLNSLYVRIDIFDDKRAAFPLLYKCVDENTAFIIFPSNIVELTNSNEISEWFKYLAAPLHRTNDVEGLGHLNKVDTAADLNINKKYILFVTAL